MLSSIPLSVAVVGATGAVGIELIHCLEKRNFPIRELRCFSSARSVGRSILFRNEQIPLLSLSSGCMQGIDLAFFCAGSSVSKKEIPLTLGQGVQVIDMSSHFRLDPDVPLIIPEINGDTLLSSHQLIASPNCCATLLLMVAAALHRHTPIKRIAVTTYQAASGAGSIAMQELKEETAAILSNQSYERSVFTHPYAFNLFPHNSPFIDESGYAEEEIKIREESRKILNLPHLPIHATCVRVPVLRAHALSLNITFEKDMPVDTAYSLLKQTSGVTVLENRKENRFPMPSDASFQDSVFCGRIRQDLSCPHTLDLWVVGDQLLKGAALNGVQIAESLLSFRFLSISP